MFEGSAERDLVGVLEVTTDRQTAGELGDPKAQRQEHPHEVGRSRLALKVRIGGDDDLGDDAILQSPEQFLDAQLIGTDTRERTDRPTEHVIPAAELSRALDRHDVLALLHHTQHRGVAPRIGADAAFGLDRDVAAHDAEVNPGLGLDEGRGEALDILGVGVEQMEGDALSALGTDARQLAELLDEILDHALVHLTQPSPQATR